MNNAMEVGGFEVTQPLITGSKIHIFTSKFYNKIYRTHYTEIPFIKYAIPLSKLIQYQQYIQNYKNQTIPYVCLLF